MNNNKFEVKTYNGISITINTEDGYVNASQMCSSNGKQWRHYKNSKIWANIINAFEKHHSKGGQIQSPSYYLDKVAPKYQGEYVHPKLVHFVAEYCSVEYAFTVAELMDSINDKVHDVLEKNHLQDTVENSKPIFKEVAKRITLKIDVDLVNGQCWGFRDDVHRLDQYEQDDLKSDIDKYNSIKQQLNANPNDTTLKKQLNESKAKLESEWKWFIPTYYPEFQY